MIATAFLENSSLEAPAARHPGRPGSTREFELAAPVPGGDGLCRACGGADVERDEVQHAGILHLAECRHCHHRWTWRAPELPEVRVALRRSSSRVRAVARPRNRHTGVTA